MSTENQPVPGQETETGKDALKSQTFYGILGGIISLVLASQGIMVETATVIGVISGIVGMFGRKKADKPITSIAGIKIS